MTRPATAVAAALLALAPAVPAGAAQDGGVRWMKSLQSALDAAKERGTPVLVWCVGDEDSAEKADHDTLRNGQVQRAMKDFLVVFANPKDYHGSRQGTLDGKPAQVCSLAPGIACRDHMNCWQEVYRSYADVLGDKSGNIKVPNHFVVDSSGKLLGTINNGTLAAGFDPVAPGDMVRGLGTLLKKAGGPGLTDEQYDRFQKVLAAARTSLESGRASEAAKALQPIVDSGKEIALVQDARDLLARIDKVATAAYARAKGLLREGKALAGLSALEAVAEEFPGTESAEMARKDAAEYRESPEGKKAMKEIQRESAGRKRLEKAVEVASAGGRDQEALRMLDAVAREFSGLPSGEEAAAKAAAIRADPDRMKAIRAAEDDRKARSALLLAKGLRDGGRKEEAIAKLEEIVREYPDTDSAKEAAELLETLR